MTGADWIIVTFAVLYALHWMAVIVGTIRVPCTGDNTASHERPSLGVAIPVYNEAQHVPIILANLEAATAIGALVVIVDDGSHDNTAALIARAWSGVTIISHERNRGKASALSTALAALSTDVVLTIDADTRLDGPTMLAGAVRFTDLALVALAIRIEVELGGLLVSAQRMEYRHVLDFERQALAAWNQVFTVPGAASFWRREALLALGGFSSRTLAEDTDATLGLRLRGGTVAADRTLVATTVVPAALAALVRQRTRWIWGTIQAALANTTDLLCERRWRTGSSILLFLVFTTMHTLSYIATVLFATRLLTVGLRSEYLVLTTCIGALTLLRLAVSRRWYRENEHRLVTMLVHLCFIQTVNQIAFWRGVLTGRAFRRYWS